MADSLNQSPAEDQGVPQDLELSHQVKQIPTSLLLQIHDHHLLQKSPCNSWCPEIEQNTHCATSINEVHIWGSEDILVLSDDASVSSICCIESPSHMYTFIWNRLSKR